jgi:hypothetical protein
MFRLVNSKTLISIIAPAEIFKLTVAVFDEDVPPLEDLGFALIDRILKFNKVSP